MGGLFPTPSLNVQELVESTKKSEVLHFRALDLERHQHFLGTHHRSFDSAVVCGHQETC